MKNRVVGIEYSLFDAEGVLIDGTSGRGALEYVHGFGNIIPGLERALEGRMAGDCFGVDVPAAEAYGERDERLIAVVPPECFRGLGEEGLRPGMRFHVSADAGVEMVTVIGVENGSVRVDGNHPLAGMDLRFELRVADVREAGADELAHGRVHGGGCGCGRGGSDCGCGGGGCCGGGSGC